MLKPSTNGLFKVPPNQAGVGCTSYAYTGRSPVDTQGSHIICPLRAAAGIKRAKCAAYMQGEVKRGQFERRQHSRGGIRAVEVFIVSDMISGEMRAWWTSTESTMRISG